jgi:hypothetical protein
MSKDIPQHWKPLVKLRPDQTFRRIEVVRETMKHYGIDEAAANTMLDAEDAKCDCYVNHLYQVQVGVCGPDNAMLHINIRRRDGGAIFDWRHMQQIKNEIAGDEREAFQIFPAESRKVDTSNKYHLWVLPVGAAFNAVGWQERDVQYEENRDVPGLRQRKL